MPVLKNAALAKQIQPEARAPQVDLRSDLEQLDSLGHGYLKQLREFREECTETAEELRLLDSQLDGITERQD